jgi:Ser/Thr protein kinase RdoA (MazF antagonist)
MTDANIAPMQLLEYAYGLQAIALHLLQVTPTKHIYCVEHAHGPPRILRAYMIANSADEQHVQAQARLLNLLEAHDYPAERVLRTIDNALTYSHQARRYLMTTYVHGQMPSYEPTALRAMGAALGQLHALASSFGHTTISIPPAGMRPAPELAYAMAQLQSVTPDVPMHMYPRYETLVTAIQLIDPCEDLPHVLIHNDCHPGNAVVTLNGTVAFIDWEGAGWGAAVIDVGFLLSSCDTESPWTPRLPPNPERVQAVIDGYCQYHMLTPSEVDRLVDAMRFRALVYGAGSFASAVRTQKPEEENPWWWTRYTAAAEIADRARQRFAHYRSLRSAV